MKNPILLPVIRNQSRDQQYVGKPGDSHNDIERRHHTHTWDDRQRCFTADNGQTFLNRFEAMEWVKAHDTALWSLVGDQISPSIGLHTTHLTPHTDVSTKRLLFVDRGGLYVWMAEELGKQYGHVDYYLLDASPYRQSNIDEIGRGLPNIRRVDSFWEVVDKADIIYFPDIYDWQWQVWLRGQGYRVFGGNDTLEIDKRKFLDVLEDANLPCPETHLIDGVDELCSFLSNRKPGNWWIKSVFRGDFETKRFDGMRQLRNWIEQDLTPLIGIRSRTVPMIVQAKIDSVCEIGYDGMRCGPMGYITDFLLGYEVKDCGLVSKTAHQVPDILAYINDAMNPYYKENDHRGHHTTEIRVAKDGTPYYIDPTERIPSPQGELFPRMWKNYGEGVWQLASGLLPRLIPAAKYGFEIVVKSTFGKDKELAVEFPEEFRDNLTFKSHCRRDGHLYCIPTKPGTGGFFCCVITWGDDWRDCMKEAIDIAKAIKAEDVDYKGESMVEELEKAIEAGEKYGIDWEG